MASQIELTAARGEYWEPEWDVTWTQMVTGVCVPSYQSDTPTCGGGATPPEARLTSFNDIPTIVAPDGIAAGTYNASTGDASPLRGTQDTVTGVKAGGSRNVVEDEKDVGWYMAAQMDEWNALQLNQSAIAQAAKHHTYEEEEIVAVDQLTSTALPDNIALTWTKPQGDAGIMTGGGPVKVYYRPMRSPYTAMVFYKKCFSNIYVLEEGLTVAYSRINGYTTEYRCPGQSGYNAEFGTSGGGVFCTYNLNGLSWADGGWKRSPQAACNAIVAQGSKSKTYLGRNVTVTPSTVAVNPADYSGWDYIVRWTITTTCTNGNVDTEIYDAYLPGNSGFGTYYQSQPTAKCDWLRTDSYQYRYETQAAAAGYAYIKAVLKTWNRYAQGYNEILASYTGPDILVETISAYQDVPPINMMSCGTTPAQDPPADGWSPGNPPPNSAGFGGYSGDPGTSGASPGGNPAGGSAGSSSGDYGGNPDNATLATMAVPVSGASPGSYPGGSSGNTSSNSSPTTTYVPDIHWTLHDGVTFPEYPTFQGALVYDTQLKKWGKIKREFKLLLDYTPVNTAGNGSISHVNYGMDAGILSDTGTIHLFTADRVDSYIKYGKLGYYRAGFTRSSELVAHFRKPFYGSLLIEPSLNGRDRDPGLAISQTFDGVYEATLPCDMSAKWYALSIVGEFDLNYLEFRGSSSGSR